jgi:hypothetical protein
MSSGELRRRTASKILRDTSESELSDGGYTETDEKPPEKENPKEHSKGDKKLAKIVKRLVFGTLLLFMLCGIIAAGHLWTLFFVRTAGFELARPCPRKVRVLLMAPYLSVASVAGCPHPSGHVPRARQRSLQPAQIQRDPTVPHVPVGLVLRVPHLLVRAVVQRAVGDAGVRRSIYKVFIFF